MMKLSLAAISLQYCWGKFPLESFPKPRKLHNIKFEVCGKTALSKQAHAHTHPQKTSSLIHDGTVSVTLGLLLKKSLVNISYDKETLDLSSRHVRLINGK